MKAQPIKSMIAVVATHLFSLSMGHSAFLSIDNHSFETGGASDGNFITSSSAGPSGWDIYGPTASNREFGVLNPSSTSTIYVGGNIPDGDNVGVTYLRGTAGEGGLQQTLADTLQLNTAYTMTVEVGNIANGSANPPAALQFDGFPGYRIDLMAGSTVLASDNNSLTIGEGLFATSAFTFTTGLSHINAGDDLGIRLVNLNGTGIEVNFDNVRLEAVAVPEPSSSTLLMAGAIAAFTVRRRPLV